MDPRLYKKLCAKHTTNGLFLNDFYLPEELIIHIISYCKPKQILKLSLVCKSWYRIVRSTSLWMKIYEREFKKKSKRVPWFVYYALLGRHLLDSNLLYSYENKVISTHCYGETYFECLKHLAVPLDRSYLLVMILERYKPHIYAAESVAGIYDCGCTETLRVTLGKEYKVQKSVGGGKYKMEIIIKDKPRFANRLIFYHERRNPNTTYCQEHFMSYAIDGEVTIPFDSLHPKENDKFILD